MSRRSSRHVHRRNYDEEDSTLAVKQPQEEQEQDAAFLSSASKRSRNDDTSPKAKKAKSINFDPKFLFTNTRSCLVTADLSEVLTAHTWELLTPEEQAECLALLPDVDKKLEPKEKPTLVDNFFSHNIFLQDSIRDLQVRLDAGFMMPGHIKKTITASHDRSAGLADAYKDEQFERFWGEKQKLDHSLSAGQTATLSLLQMISSGVFHDSDIFRYSRSFQTEKGKMNKTIEKDCELVAHTKKDCDVMLTFRIPAKDGKYLRAGEDFTEISDIVNLAQLETFILNTDGQIAKADRPNGNSWKTFRLIRKVTDLGSLFEVRERVYHA